MEIPQNQSKNVVFQNKRIMKKFIITGGSGFIGTNLIEKLLGDSNLELMSLDIKAPKIETHRQYWKQVDLRNRDDVMVAIKAFAPDCVIHLGTRTDLNGATLQDYDANMGGVRNVLDAIAAVGTVKRAIFASSMYVCEPGYMPKDFEDYAPHTLYGESKVETEKIIKSTNPSYTWNTLEWIKETNEFEGGCQSLICYTIYLHPVERRQHAA